LPIGIYERATSYQCFLLPISVSWIYTSEVHAVQVAEHPRGVHWDHRELYVFTMCHTEDVFHGPCRHWGRERFIGGPCCRSRIVNGRHTGCGYIEKIGAVNSSELCSDCKFRLTRGRGWKPFAHVSNDGWAKIEEKLRKRSEGSDDYLYLQNGSSQTPFQKRDYSSIAQS
jgi:hypothetical protein